MLLLLDNFLILNFQAMHMTYEALALVLLRTKQAISLLAWLLVEINP